MSLLLFLRSAMILLPLAGHQDSGGVLGYYRTPAIHGNTVVFTAEGDLWRVSAQGGSAQRLTSHPSTETYPAISPDGKRVAFTAAYEGPNEVYVMPIDGGVPTRCTYEGANAEVVGWTSDGSVIYTTSRYSTLPSYKLCLVNPTTHRHSVVPLAQAHDGSYSGDGKQLFFTRLSFQGSQTKRYKGGTAQNIWRWDGGNTEAKPLTADFPGTSRTPMWWNGRVYFASDRDGVMNIWSMDGEGHNLKQHTHHTDYDVYSPSMDNGEIVYQHGADIYKLDVKTGTDSVIPVRLTSDFDQMRETWVKNPLGWVTSAHLSNDGTKVALTARGQVFIAPVKPGRLIETTRKKSVRYRDARFAPDGKSVIALSDESGEVELWKLDPLGEHSHAPEQLTKDSCIIKWQTKPSPDGKWIAHTDKNLRLYLYDATAKTNKKIAESPTDTIDDLAWSADSKYLAFTEPAANTYQQIKVYELATGKTIEITTDHFNSSSPAFTPDGKFLYFLSDRHIQTSVTGPWGYRAPEPYFDKTDQIYYVPLQAGNRSPFQADDELTVEKKEPEASKVLPAIDPKGILARLALAPIPAGNYSGLSVCGNRLYFLSRAGDGPESLVSVVLRNQNIKVDTVLSNVLSFETTSDGKKILARSGMNILVFDANGMPADPNESRVNLDGWTFSFDPKEEWHEMFDEAWRLHRDYLYATNMQGVDWPAMKRKYRGLVDRVTDRAELSDVLAQMVGEISLLHTFVYGGDRRPGTDSIEVGSLGATWTKEPSLGGYKLDRLYRTDPDTPELKGPLLKPGVELSEGDVIATIDGIPTLSVDEPASLLRAKAGKQIRITVYPAGAKANAKDVIVTPISVGQESSLRYGDWEYSRRQVVETQGKGNLGYVHLRAMGGGDYNQWATDFYPVFDRQGLIIDVRHNNGGNIDSWILEKLIRKAWMYWNHHAGNPQWNMQYAFRGKVVVLCDENTASDGEAFSEGFRRLGLGKVIGTRTWGGEVWLSSDNTLVDRGIATAAEDGVYGPEGHWLIEGHGVDPDIIIDNLPHATFLGADAQLEAAIKYLQGEIEKHPNPVPPVPPLPDKSFHPKGGG